MPCPKPHLPSLYVPMACPTTNICLFETCNKENQDLKTELLKTWKQCLRLHQESQRLQKCLDLRDKTLKALRGQNKRLRTSLKASSSRRRIPTPERCEIGDDDGKRVERYKFEEIHGVLANSLSLNLQQTYVSDQEPVTDQNEYAALSTSIVTKDSGARKDEKGKTKGRQGRKERKKKMRMMEKKWGQEQEQEQDEKTKGEPLSFKISTLQGNVDVEPVRLSFANLSLKEGVAVTYGPTDKANESVEIEGEQLAQKGKRQGFGQGSPVPPQVGQHKISNKGHPTIVRVGVSSVQQMTQKRKRGGNNSDYKDDYDDSGKGIVEGKKEGKKSRRPRWVVEDSE
ncbi:hypothetical protein ABW20_dc0110308 [Dactylellina cionopaga]|nr:hypothetical protein ABW20_dc0110308 [Dactylellina cionopaga]